MIGGLTFHRCAGLFFTLLVLVASPAPNLLRPYASTNVCVATVPNGRQPPTHMLGGPMMHGNGKLWVALPIRDDGKTAVAPDSDGVLGIKLPWWRGVQGQLTLTGRRLDASEPLLRTNIPPGYGNTGFQSSAVFLAHPGCWEITGSASDTRLTFVMNVIRCGETGC